MTVLNQLGLVYLNSSSYFVDEMRIIMTATPFVYIMRGGDTFLLVGLI